MNQLSIAVDLWRSQPPSRIGSHSSGECCSLARSWLQGMASSHVEDENARWVRERWEWGPNRWPVHWCEAARADSLDCGALADISALHLDAIGRSYRRVQAIMEYPESDVRHWARMWQARGIASNWIHGSLIYHEVLGVSDTKGSIAFWDPSGPGWLPQLSVGEAGRVVAVKVHGGGTDTWVWGSVNLTSGEWALVGVEAT